MKWINNKAFPFPVLSDEGEPEDRDYVNREFQTSHTLAFLPKSSQYELKISYKLSEKSLLDLIKVKDGSAKYAVGVHCRATYLRELLTSETSEISHTFEKGALHGQVEISPYLLCTQEIKKHDSKSFHSDFDGMKFDIPAGSVLALAHPKMYHVHLDPMKSIGSIFVLVPADSKDKDFSVSWDNNKIEIMMCQENARQFNLMTGKDSMLSLLLSSVYLSTLTETLRQMTTRESEEISELEWYRVIEHKIHSKKISLVKSSNFLQIAQMLLEYPVHVMLAEDTQ